jgi:putative RecB family exonuclease
MPTALELPATLSPSKVGSFKDCGLAFKFSAIDKLPEPSTVPQAKGTLVHRSLELLYGLEPAERTEVRALELLDPAAADVLHGEEYAELWAGLDATEQGQLLTDARRCVARLFELENPMQVQPEGLELMLEAELNGVRLRGIIDRLERDADGGLVVTDYKTGRVPGERWEQGKLDGVHFYAWLCEQVLGERPVRVQLYYLAQPLAIVASPTDQTIRGFTLRSSAIWRAIEQACERDDFRPNPGKLCSWCGFAELCPAMGAKG